MRIPILDVEICRGSKIDAYENTLKIAQRLGERDRLTELTETTLANVQGILEGMSHRKLKSEALIDRLDGCLQMAQWVWDPNAKANYCPSCGQSESDGHIASCGVAVTLAAVKEWREGK